MAGLRGLLTTPTHGREPCGTTLFQRAHFPLFSRPASAATAALTTRSADDVFEIVIAVVIGNFLVRLNISQRPDEHAAAIGVGLCIRIAGMIGVSGDIAARGAIDGDPRVDLVEVAVAAPFESAGFLGTHASAFIFDDFFALLDRPNGEQAEAGERTADTKRSSGHCGGWGKDENRRCGWQMKRRASIVVFRRQRRQRRGGLGSRKGSAAHTARQASAVSKHAKLVHGLMKESARPTDKCGELVRVDQKVNNERYRGQHEHQVSHRIFPVLTR